ncbi:MAG: PQQ-binding-like beta-propeller repeat protein, partial [Polyangiaceae bacterium]|nr:PQQ-binding-like beta-propeller repeat protein [Polyangiaceae bacterium]
MELHPSRSSGSAHGPGADLLPNTPRLDALESLILGEPGDGIALPAVTELTAALTALARGAREKVLLPHTETATELALLRRGESVLVSCYGTGSSPDVHVLDRAVRLDSAIAASVEATMESAEHESDPIAKQIALRMAERALRASRAIESRPSEPTIRRSGGARAADEDEAPLSFGYDIALHPPSEATSTATSRADIHALLFDGTLWAFVRGRRVVLSRGPIILAVQRMVAVVRSLVEARDAGKPVHLRLRAGGFRIAARTTPSGEVTVALGGEGGPEVTATALTLPAACLPILRVTTDLLRALVSVDRSQGRNLRVRSLREEVRALRRAVNRKRHSSFVNLDADRLRLEMSSPSSSSVLKPSERERPSQARALRFGERWRLGMDGLDAMTTFLCGDRLVLATAHHTVALSRDRGEVLWARDGEGTSVHLAGSSLVRVDSNGELELCDVSDGEPYATARISPRVGGPMQVLSACGHALPPMAVLTEGSHRLVAIDLRTGEPRWRFASLRGGAFEMTKAGRILLVACGEGTLHALDLATGDELWRHAADTRFPFAPTVVGDVVFAVSSGGV